MPRDAGGTYTLPAGNPVITGTTIDASWANTTMDDITTVLTDSLSRTGNGGMLVAFEFADGTVALPGITFTNETNSGIYRAATNDVRFSIAGVDRTRWRANALNPFQVWNGAVWTNVLSEGGDATITAAWVFSGTLTIPAASVTAHVAAIDHDLLLNYVANQHVDHTSVSVLPGTGMSGGGTIASTRTLNADIASESVRGMTETATQGEVDTGTDALRYVTPLTLKTASTVPRIQRKEKDGTNTDRDTTITPTADPDLAGFAFLADVLYTIEVFLIVSTPTTTTPGFRWTFADDGGGGTIRHEMLMSVREDTGTFGAGTQATFSSGAVKTLTFSNTARRYFHFIGQFRRNVSGNLDFQWAQSVSDADPTRMHIGSWMELREGGS